MKLVLARRHDKPHRHRWVDLFSDLFNTAQFGGRIRPQSKRNMKYRPQCIGLLSGSTKFCGKVVVCRQQIDSQIVQLKLLQPFHFGAGKLVDLTRYLQAQTRQGLLLLVECQGDLVFGLLPNRIEFGYISLHLDSNFLRDLGPFLDQHWVGNL